jgi:uncharacterized protein (TIGR03437 family)
MKKLAFVCFLLPAASVGQDGQSITARVAGILANGVQGGAQGLYLRQSGGGVLAVQQDRYVFDPSNAVAVIPLLYAYEGMRVGALTATTPVVRYTNGATSCPNPPIVSGTEPMGTALREMMWHSDNARMHAVQSHFGRSTIDAFSRALGLRTTLQPQVPGCQTAGRTTLGDLAVIWDGVVTGTLPTFGRQAFLNTLPGKAQAAAEGSDFDHLWDLDIPRMIRQEAPTGMTQAQMAQFQNQMDLGYKSGAVVSCQQQDCGRVVEDLSIAGWARIPFCSGGQTVSRDYIFGAFLSGAQDLAYSAGKSTAAQQAFVAGRAELLREQIRDGLASCHGGSAVLVTPVPGSTLSGRTVGFAWSSAANATGYRLDVGTTPAGTQLGTIFTTNTGAVVTNLPCNNSTVYVRLWTRIELYGSPKDYSFRACSLGGPLITSPTPGTVISSPSVTFTWTALTDADFYRLSVGSTLGGSDVEQLISPTTAATINNIPTDGRIVFVRIQGHHPELGYGTANDYAYNNVTGVAPVVASVLNAASLRPNLSAACLAILTGSNFASDVVVTVGGTVAQLVGPPSGSRITFVVPPSLAVGTHNLVIASGAGRSEPTPIVLAAASPAMFTPLLDAAGAPLPPGRSLKAGDTVIARAVGLGRLGPDGRPALTVRVSVGTVAAAVLSTTPAANSPGVVEIAFRIPGSVLSGTQPVVITAGSTAGAPVQLVIAGPAINGVLNGASFATGAKVAPGSLVALFGTDLATEDRFGMYPSPVLPGNGVITIGGVSAPLFDVVASAGQINLLVPFETQTEGNVAVVVTNSMGTSIAFQLAMAPVAPGIFRIADPAEPKRFNAAALVANTAWRVIPSSMAAAYGMAQNCRANGVDPAAICGEPALPGDPIQIYVTGLGRATVNGNPFGNALRTGDVAPASGNPLYQTVETPRVTIGGIEATVVFSGVAPGFAGLYQVNVIIPPGVAVGDDVPVTIEIGGVSDTATIAIRRP